jgi:hypothetical protein
MKKVPRALLFAHPPALASSEFWGWLWWLVLGGGDRRKLLAGGGGHGVDDAALVWSPFLEVR